MAGVFCFNDLKELCKSKERSLVEEYDRYQAYLEKRVEEYDRYQAYLEKRAEEWAAKRAKEDSSISEEEKEAVLAKPPLTEKEKRNRQEYLEFMQTLARDIEERNERAARKDEERDEDEEAGWCAETMTPFEKTK